MLRWRYLRQDLRSRLATLLSLSCEADHEGIRTTPRKGPPVFHCQAMTPSIEAIKANCNEVGNCWEWKGALDHKAPVMRNSETKRLIPVRKCIMEIRGRMKEGHLACTKCDNHLCVNPDHIICLTRKQLQQKTAKASKYGKSVSRSKKLSDARRSRGTVLSMEAVREMRADGLSSRQAAKKYGCGQYAAWLALAGKTWKEYNNPFAGLMTA